MLATLAVSCQDNPTITDCDYGATTTAHACGAQSTFGKCKITHDISTSRSHSEAHDSCNNNNSSSNSNNNNLNNNYNSNNYNNGNQHDPNSVGKSTPTLGRERSQLCQACSYTYIQIYVHIYISITMFICILIVYLSSCSLAFHMAKPKPTTTDIFIECLLDGLEHHATFLSLSLSLLPAISVFDGNSPGFCSAPFTPIATYRNSQVGHYYYLRLT